jgi:hypothetical protein
VRRCGALSMNRSSRREEDLISRKKSEPRYLGCYHRVRSWSQCVRTPRSADNVKLAIITKRIKFAQRSSMPEKQTIKRAQKDKREGKAPSTQAGEFVREEIHHIREGKHGARSTKQAIAIGLSKARRAGVKLTPPAKGTVSERTRRTAKKAYEKGQSRSKRQISPKRSRATLKALRSERHSVVSRKALSRQARTTAKQRSAKSRSASAKKAARTRRRLD